MEANVLQKRWSSTHEQRDKANIKRKSFILTGGITYELEGIAEEAAAEVGHGLLLHLSLFSLFSALHSE